MSRPTDPNDPQPTGYTAYDPVTGQPLSRPGYDTTGQPAAGYSGPYGQPGYAQPPYGQAYGQPGYPAPGYGYPMGPPPPRRPGTAVAIAVLNFVQSASVLSAGIALLAGSDVVRGYGYDGSLGAELTLIAIATLAAGALLIAGGVTVLSNKLPLTFAGCGLSLALSVYWLVRPWAEGLDEVSGWIGVVLLWSVLPIISLSLTPSVNKWLQQRSGTV